MDFKEFASKIRNKYPGSYDNIDDKTLAQAVIRKYPAYKDQVTFESAFKIPEPLRKGAELATMPQRGMRGVGVGLQRLVKGTRPFLRFPGESISATEQAQIGQNIPQAIERAAEAVKPTYKPQPGERVGAMAGETIGAMPLATLIGGAAPAAGIKEPIRLGYQMVRSGAAGGALSALDQAVSKGEVNPGQIGQIAKYTAALPLIKPVADVVRKIALKSVPRLLSITQAAPELATERMLKDPSMFKKFKGTEAAIEQRVLGIQQALVNARREAGKIIGKVKGKLGIEETFEKGIERLSGEGVGTRNPQEIATDFLEYITTPKNKLKSSKEQLKFLVGIKDDIYDLVSFPKPGVTVPAIRSMDEKLLKDVARQADDLMQKVQGGKRLRWANEGYHHISEIYDQLQKDLADPGKAEDVIEKLFKGQSVLRVTGANKQRLKALRKLEKWIGKDLIDPLFGEFSAQAFKQWLPMRGLTTPISLMGSITMTAMKPWLGVPASFALSPMMSRMGIRAAQGMTGTATSPAGKALLTGLIERGNRPRQPQNPLLRRQ